jgi:hypothetical protein
MQEAGLRDSKFFSAWHIPVAKIIDAAVLAQVLTLLSAPGQGATVPLACSHGHKDSTHAAGSRQREIEANFLPIPQMKNGGMWLRSERPESGSSLSC